MTRYRIRDDVNEFVGNECFVCLARLFDIEGPQKRTLEHLIPQWIIKKFDLQSHTITIGALGRIGYMDFLLPCCAECNCTLLAPIEKLVSSGLRGNDPTRIDEERLAQWVAKIILGAQFYDRLSKTDRLQLSGGEKVIREYLAGLRGKVSITHYNQFDYPMSLFWFRTKLRSQARRNFDFQVAPTLQCMYLRLGQWSLLARADAGYIRRNGANFFKEYLDKELAPIQIEELAAHFFTMAELAKGDHIVQEDKLPSSAIRIERIELSRRNPFHEPSEDMSEFLGWFTYFTGAGKGDLILGHDSRRTFLKYDSGEHLDCPAEFGWH